MGALGYGPFDNDMALDFVDQVVATRRGNALIEKTLKKITGPKAGYLDNDDCCCAIAAAEIIAKAKGSGAREIPPDVAAWIRDSKFEPTTQMVEQAVKACQAILSESESKELWENDAGWRASIQRTIKRLERVAEKPTVAKSSQPIKSKPAATKKATAGGENLTKVIAEVKKRIAWLEMKRGKPIRAMLEAEHLTADLIGKVAMLGTLKRLEVEAKRKLADEIFDPFAQLTQLEWIDFSGVEGLRDRHLQFCRQLPNLTFVDIRNKAALTDETLEHLAGCHRLEHLFIDDAQISDAGMKSLANMPNLKCLYVNNTGITDEGLKRIAPCSALMSLHFDGTKVKGNVFKTFATHGLQYLTLNDDLSKEAKRNLKARYIGCPVQGPDEDIDWD